MVFSEDIPYWIHSTAEWWANDSISDKEFINAVEFLINNEIIVIQVGEISDSKEQKSIPSWVKQNAKWWSENQINDDTFLQGLKFLVELKIININQVENEIINFSGDSTLFTKYAYKKDFRNINGQMIPIESHFKLNEGMEKTYEEIGFFNQKSDTVVVTPLFTSTAYWEPGFYSYYRGECEEICLTKKIDFEKPFGFSGSESGFKILKLLNYHIFSDFEMAKNPQIINKYDKVILLHNEYVTKQMFETITDHPKVVYLYPNALYGEVKFNEENETITLIRGHSYPSADVDNGFEWEFDNTRPYEFDSECLEWEFYEIDNGIMLNCYPENVLFTNFEMLKEIKEY